MPEINTLNKGENRGRPQQSKCKAICSTGSLVKPAALPGLEAGVSPSQGQNYMSLNRLKSDCLLKLALHR